LGRNKLRMRAVCLVREKTLNFRLLRMSQEARVNTPQRDDADEHVLLPSCNRREAMFVKPRAPLLQKIAASPIRATHRSEIKSAFRACRRSESLTKRRKTSPDLSKRGSTCQRLLQTTKAQISRAQHEGVTIKNRGMKRHKGRPHVKIHLANIARSSPKRSRRISCCKRGLSGESADRPLSILTSRGARSSPRALASRTSNFIPRATLISTRPSLPG
jgi:hypothetical protein